MQDPQLCNQLPRELGKREGRSGDTGSGTLGPSALAVGPQGMCTHSCTHAHMHTCAHVYTHALDTSMYACIHLKGVQPVLVVQVCNKEASQASFK